MSYAQHAASVPVRPLVSLVLTLGALTALATPPAHAHVPDPLPASPLRDKDLTALGAEIFRGQGFDTCEAPSSALLRDWLASPYRAIGIYIGGRGRACPEQPNLTPEWVTEVTTLGWRLLPLYVGSQSPCVRGADKAGVPIDSAWPREQGAAEAEDAIAAAQALGLAPGSPIYLDMEDYDHHDAYCADVTLSFVQGFSSRLRDQGWIPGYYSSATSGIAHLESARLAGEPDLPDVLWYARWDTPPTLHAEPALDPAAWQPNRRIHQYAGEVTETYEGRPLNIDRNVVHAPVAVLADDHQVNP